MSNFREQELERVLANIIQNIDESDGCYTVEVEGIGGVAEVAKLIDPLADAIDRAKFVLYEQEGVDAVGEAAD